MAELQQMQAFKAMENFLRIFTNLFFPANCSCLHLTLDWNIQLIPYFLLKHEGERELKKKMLFDQIDHPLIFHVEGDIKCKNNNITFNVYRTESISRLVACTPYC